MTNAERQKAFRDAQLELFRTKRLTFLTEEEHFFLQRVLHHMREHPHEKPATMRNTVTGRFSHLDT